jgi:hypothetical protein
VLKIYVKSHIQYDSTIVDHGIPISGMREGKKRERGAEGGWRVVIISQDVP